MNIPSDDVGLLLKALNFSAKKHSNQRRKGQDATPYINHPIQVAEILWQIGGIHDMIVIIAALLHDTLEDTDATTEEIERLFGKAILNVVLEVTDDKTLPKMERKRLQIQNAPHKSIFAKQLKLADKICNINDIIHSPPHTWSPQRQQEYIAWTQQVIAGIRGTNAALENYYDDCVMAFHRSTKI